MAVLPLRWQGASRVQHLREIVLEHARRWAVQWMPTPLHSDVVVETLRGQRSEIVDIDTRWYALQHAGAALSLRVSRTTFEDIGCAMTGLGAADDAGLAVGLGVRALTDLARGVFTTNVSEPLAALQGAPATAAIGLRHGAAGFEITVDDIRFELHFDAALCATLLPSKTTISEKPTARHEAIAQLDASFDAVLDLGHIALADTVRFVPGDVLKTSVPIGADMRLVTANGGEILRGALVENDGRRALKITKTHISGKTKS
jgi:hypothetical protein